MKRISLFAMTALLSAFLAGPAHAQFQQPPLPPWAKQTTVTVTDKYYESLFHGAQAARDGGYFIPISKECMVRNVAGNCGYCSIEIIARHLGMKQMEGFSRGKHGCTSDSMARELDRVGVKYKNATGRNAGIATMKEFLAADCPVLFSIPRHALVCCGWTDTPELGERIWVVDNTGREGCVIKGWTKAEFDRRYDGWVMGLFPIFPGRPWHPRTPPAPAPAPHVDPPTDLVTNPLAKRVDDVESRLKALEKDDGKAVLGDKLQKVEGKLPEILATVQSLSTQVGGLPGLAKKVEEDLPKLNGLVDKLKTDGVLSEEKAAKVREFLDKVAPHVNNFAEFAKKADPEIQALKSAVPWGAILGGAVPGGLGMILSIVLPLLLRSGKGSGTDPLHAILALLAAKNAPAAVAAPSPPTA